MLKTYKIEIEFISDSIISKSNSYTSNKINDIFTILNNYNGIMEIPLKSIINGPYSVSFSFIIKIQTKNINNFILDILKIKDCIELNIK